MRCLLLALCLFLLGCVSTQKAIDNYNYCKGDVACETEMARVKAETYEIVKNTVHSAQFPSIPEAVALLASNIVAFGFGVLKGRKKAS